MRCWAGVEWFGGERSLVCCCAQLHIKQYMYISVYLAVYDAILVERRQCVHIECRVAVMYGLHDIRPQVSLCTFVFVSLLLSISISGKPLTLA